MIQPTVEERERICEVAETLVGLVNEAAGELGVNARGLLVGSAARDTWLRGDHDLDVFIVLPRSEKLETGLEIARRAARRAERIEEKYAEHPYLHIYFDGFEVDLVPCFGVSSPAEMLSAVDRTPLHNHYVQERIRGRENEARLLKQFLRAAGIYGSELKTKGFSGYLVELLVIKYGSFLEVLNAALNWRPGKRIEPDPMVEPGDAKNSPEKHLDLNAPLVVVDPTDPNRNVAAALSLESLARFVDRARDFLEEPCLEKFLPPSPRGVSDDEIKSELGHRGTGFIAVVFQHPGVVEDILYPQLYKMEKSAWKLIEQWEFRLMGSFVWASQERAGIFFELEVSQLPPLKIHTGPPVWDKIHGKAFKKKHSRVYIRGDKYEVEIPRKHTTAKKLLEERFLTCSLGKHIKETVKKKGFQVLEGPEITGIQDRDFRENLYRYLNKTIL